MEPYRDDPSTLPPDCVFANLRARLRAEGPVPDWVFKQVKLIHARRVRLEQEYRWDGTKVKRQPDGSVPEYEYTRPIADIIREIGPELPGEGRPGGDVVERPKRKPRIVKTTFTNE